MLEKILNHLKSEGWDIVKNTENSITTHHEWDGGEFRVTGCLGKSFPHQPPEFFLEKRSSFDLLAHVSRANKDGRGTICGGTSDGLSLNYQKPELVYEGCLEMAVDTVLKELGNPEFNRAECLREFCGHWKECTNGGASLVFIGDSCKVLDRLQVKSGRAKPRRLLERKILVTHRGLSGLPSSYPLVSEFRNRASEERAKAYAVPFSDLPLPPVDRNSIKSWWREVLSSLGDEERKAFASFSHYNKAHEAYLVLCAEYQGQTALFGLHCFAAGRKPIPLTLDSLDEWRFEAVNIDAHNREYLLPRGGASAAIQEKRVLLVGCGAIGCEIAHGLASAAVGRLTMVDPDTFSQDNLYRHTLSLYSEGATKSVALGHQLGMHYPWTDCVPLKDKLLDIEDSVLVEQDLIVVAIGNTTHELAFNAKMHSSELDAAVMNVWLEPCGIGGHAVLSLNNGDCGCYGCTFFQTDQPHRRQLTSNLNFIAAGQAVARNAGTCGGVYLPYSKLDATETALMATRLALDFCLGKVERSVSVSWSCGFERKPEILHDVRHTQRFMDFEESKGRLPLGSKYCDTCHG